MGGSYPLHTPTRQVVTQTPLARPWPDSGESRNEQGTWVPVLTELKTSQGSRQAAKGNGINGARTEGQAGHLHREGMVTGGEEEGLQQERQARKASEAGGTQVYSSWGPHLCSRRKPVKILLRLYFILPWMHMISTPFTSASRAFP